MTQREITALKQKAELYEMAFDCAVEEMVGKLNLTFQESRAAEEKIKKRILQDSRDAINKINRALGYNIKNDMRHKESTIQAEAVKWFRMLYPGLKKRLIAVPNGGQRNATTARILKAEGVVPGVSDLVLFKPSQGFGALLIEMKTDTGRQSELQKEWEADLTKENEYKYVVCRSVDEFIKEVQNYLKA